jgi:hypothetical protein
MASNNQSLSFAIVLVGIFVLDVLLSVVSLAQAQTEDKRNESLLQPSSGAQIIGNRTALQSLSNMHTINQSVVVISQSQRIGPLFVKQVYPDRVVGLNFPAYPIGTRNGIPTLLHIGENVTDGCKITLILNKIQDKVATFSKTEYPNIVCPIC